MDINPEVRKRILQAAEELVAQGNEDPTNSEIRAKMGKGSLAHISPVMREWRQGRMDMVAQALEIPTELRRSIELSLSQVWGVANKMASGAIDLVREQSQEKIDAVSQERDEALEEVTRLEAEVSSLVTAHDGLQGQFAELKGDVEVQTVRADKATMENSGLKDRIKDRDTQIKELKAQLAEERKANKALQGELLGLVKKK